MGIRPLISCEIGQIHNGGQQTASFILDAEKTFCHLRHEGHLCRLKEILLLDCYVYLIVSLLREGLTDDVLSSLPAFRSVPFSVYTTDVLNESGIQLSRYGTTRRVSRADKQGHLSVCIK